jgi:hypothetical protein
VRLLCNIINGLSISFFAKQTSKEKSVSYYFRNAFESCCLANGSCRAVFLHEA